MKPYSQIVEETGIPISTLGRYIKELHDEGLIERRQALYSRTKEQGGFEVKKGTYIHITDKLLSLINNDEQHLKTPSTPQITHNIHKDSHQNIQTDKLNIKPTCNEFTINERIDPLKMSESNISNLYTKSLSNIISNSINFSVDNSKNPRLTQQFKTIHQFLYSEIKEEIPDEIKKFIAGTFYNITFVHKKQFSQPKQVVAEYLFSLLNTEFYLPNVKDFKHRNNILAQIVRTNNWKTPKGFYNYFYLGQYFKDKNELHAEKQQAQKAREINPILLEFDDLEAKLEEKSILITNLKENISSQKSNEEKELIQKIIQINELEVEQLWEEYRILVQKQKNPNISYINRQCA